MIMLHRGVMVPALIAVALVPAAAQVVRSDGPKPQFEVATVRPNNSGESNASLGVRPGGRVMGTNQTLRNLVRNAFNLQPYQIVGGPDWMDSARWDIQAKVADTDLDDQGMMPPPQLMMRLQALLEDRFKLVARWETRELPVYALVLSTPGTIGPKLKVHAGECDRPAGGATPAAGNVPINCGTRSSVTSTFAKVTGSGITMVTFARNLSGTTGRYVVDKTGLAGAYDLELEFTPDQSPDTNGPSLFTAMQEQLGLKLDSQRAPVDVLVIDNAQKPEPD
jgi:uncharacterized protein (TIGR03435 family)